MKPFVQALALSSAFCLAAGSPAAGPHNLHERQTYSTPPACPLSFTPSNKPASRCGTLGRLFKPAPLGNQRTADTALACAEICRRYKPCVSFGFSSVKSLCQLYEKPINKMGFSPRKDANHTALYNFNCYTPGGNLGIQYATYINNEPDPTDPSDSNFDPTVFKTQTPTGQNVNYYLGQQTFDPGQGQVELYEQTLINTTYFAVNHRGYIAPTLNGTYTFQASAADIALFWLGDVAYSGWTRANAIYETTADNEPDQISFDLIAGQYYPFRLLWANSNGDCDISTVMADPRGYYVSGFGQLFGYTSEVIQYTCDLKTAPPFPDFGSET